MASSAAASSSGQSLTSSLRNEGPRARSVSRIRRLFSASECSPSIVSGRSASQAAACSRGKSATRSAGFSPLTAERDAQPRPRRLAREAQHVEPRRIVVLEAGGQHGAFPGAGRQFDAVERRQHAAKAVDAGQVVRLGDAVPDEQKALEIGRRDRLDFGAQPVERVAMDARQQPAVAPFDIGRAAEAAAQHDTFGLEGEERRVGVGPGDRHRRREGRRRGRSDHREPAANQLDDRVVACPLASDRLGRHGRASCGPARRPDGRRSAPAADRRRSRWRRPAGRRAPRASNVRAPRTNPTAALRPPRRTESPR